MKEIGIIGNPLGHTLSPKIHESAFKELNLNITFKIWDTKKEDLEKQIFNLRNTNILGSCVTLPYKQKVIQYLDDIDETAKEMNAVNWIVNKNGKLKGHNTDGQGFSISIFHHNKEIKNKNCLVLGAGGSSKAICLSIIKENAKSLYIYNRTYENAKSLIKSFTKYNNIKIIDEEKLNSKTFIREIDLIVNTTSLGMEGGPNPKKSPINTDIINKNALCYDLVYSPTITPFLQGAIDNSIEQIGGLTMLVFQAAIGFELVTNKKAPLDKMLESVGIINN
ncbi:MAG: shikimate dehydrogenase [Dehalococcoidales bacterium]|nr:shikimate dehydrogenase [Dehalococcoidales bacterium]